MPDTKARKLDTDSVIGFGGRQMANARLANIELRKNTDTHRRRIDYPPPPPQRQCVGDRVATASSVGFDSQSMFSLTSR